MADSEQSDYTTLTVQLLSAYVANNMVDSSDLAGLIQSTRAALIGEVVASEPAAPEHVPAVSIRKSIASKDHIISLIDGRPYKTLKRHLSAHGLNPDSYRERYGLPKSYPMVAPDYADIRRAVAQRNGLGQRSATTTVETPAEAAAPVAKARKPRVAKAAGTPAVKKVPAAKSAARAATATAAASPAVAAKSDEAPKAATRRKLGIKTAGSSPSRKSKAQGEAAAE